VFWNEETALNTELLISVITIAGTLLLVVTGLLNFSVFVRQLRAAREQLETAQRHLENARQQPEIQLVQRAMDETSDHLKILIDRPYLRPYFYDNRIWNETDGVSADEIKAMAELMLNNFASAIIHSAAFHSIPCAASNRRFDFICIIARPYAISSSRVLIDSNSPACLCSA